MSGEDISYCPLSLEEPRTLPGGMLLRSLPLWLASALLFTFTFKVTLTALPDFMGDPT